MSGFFDVENIGLIFRSCMSLSRYARKSFSVGVLGTVMANIADAFVYASAVVHGSLSQVKAARVVIMETGSSVSRIGRIWLRSPKIETPTVASSRGIFNLASPGILV